MIKVSVSALALLLYEYGKSGMLWKFTSVILIRRYINPLGPDDIVITSRKNLDNYTDANNKAPIVKAMVTEKTRHEQIKRLIWSLENGKKNLSKIQGKG